MTRLAKGCDTHLKFDLTEDEKERFRWACYYFGVKHGEKWPMGKVMRSLMHNFTEDMLKDAEPKGDALDS